MKSIILSLLLIALPQAAIAKEKLLFLGSSSIEYWKTMDKDFPEYETINEGVGGWTYRSLADNAAALVSKHPDARKIVLYAGDNDVAVALLRSPEAIFEDFIDTLNEIDSVRPEAKIYVISVKPSPFRRYALGKIEQVNDRIRGISAELGHVTFVDVYPEMLTGGRPNRALFKLDGLHMNDAGYRIWTQHLNEALKKR